ncbi:metallophosphoesterase [Anaeramoeba flamelloides]|uniref:Metallophosphoesterase n=1 Tax=Anaeramoeba flamelloides TaxID=1746091 RepID=A0ABQ8XSX2_9EUKA|nr:metallophosphoesterase [Anaeramoeba flamelloides]
MNKRSLTILLIADTHGNHDRVQVPTEKIDVLIHAGDLSKMGKTEHLKSYDQWTTQIATRCNLFVSGNHEKRKLRLKTRKWIKKTLPNNIFLRNDEYTIDDLVIWGSPYRPLKSYKKLIPKKAQILVCHSPPYLYNDLTYNYKERGLKGIYKGIESNNINKEPRIYVCGHVHEGYGIIYEPELNCWIINCCVVGNERNPIYLKAIYNEEYNYYDFEFPEKFNSLIAEGEKRKPFKKKKKKFFKK